MQHRGEDPRQTVAKAHMIRRVDFGESAVNISPRRGRRRQMAAQRFAIANAFSGGILQFLEFEPALPALFEVIADLSGCDRSGCPVHVTEQFLAFRVTHGRYLHCAPFFSLAMARRRNSPTVDALMPRIEPISG